MILRRSDIVGSALLSLLASLAGAATPDEMAEANRAMTGSVAEEASGYSSWDVQFLYGSQFQEPFNPNDVSKAIVTIENSSAWSWGSSYFFVDTAYSIKNDQNSDGKERHAWDGYAEWYPSASIGKLSGTNLSAWIINDVSLTAGLNYGRKTTGAEPLIYLPGLTFDLSLPGFAFFSLGTYAYIDRGTVNNGDNNGCHSTGLQITPSWLLPFSIGTVDFQFAGFLDYITKHGDCKAQVVSQPQLTVDMGKLLGMNPGKLYAGTEFQYWNNKFGIEGLDEHFPQALLIYRF